MALYIDSSNYSEIEQALETGWVYGITTNPILLKQNADAPEKVLEKLGKYPVAEVFYQVKSTNIDSMQQEVETATNILGEKLVVKIPPTKVGFQFAAQIAQQRPICITAVFSPAQAIIAKELGATYLAVYVNRATRLLGDGVELAGQIAALLANSKTKLLAASIKSSQEFINIAHTGIQDFTLPYTVLSALSEHPASLAAVQDFDRMGSYLIGNNSKSKSFV